MGNKRVPEIRLAGYSGKWEKKKLGDLFNVYSGQTPLRSDSSNFDNPNTPWIKTTDLNNSSITVNEEDISEKAAGKLKILERDTVLIAMYGGFNQIGRTGILTYPATINQALSALEPNEEIIPYFLITELNYRIKEWQRLATSSRKDPNITKKDVENFIFKYPKYDEQTKIGSLFKQLDDTISIQEQELETLKLTKQGFLQKMFPKEGESVPEIRFPGFTEDWELLKLDSLVDRVKSYSLSRNVEKTEDTGYKYVHYGDIHTKVADTIDEYSNLPNIESGNYELLKKGDVVLADASEDYQGIAAPAVVMIEPPYKLVSGLHTIALRPKQVDSLFLYYLIHSQPFRKYGYRTGTGMKVFGISVKSVLEFEGNYPLLEEQIKIGIFFKQLDDSIALHQQELETLKQTQKAFLQKMFV